MREEVPLQSPSAQPGPSEAVERLREIFPDWRVLFEGVDALFASTYSDALSSHRSELADISYQLVRDQIMAPYQSAYGQWLTLARQHRRGTMDVKTYESLVESYGLALKMYSRAIYWSQRLMEATSEAGEKVRESQQYGVLFELNIGVWRCCA